MIKATYHDFRLLRWVICPVCPTKSRDITSSGWARTGSGGGRGGFGSGAPCPSDHLPMITNKARTGYGAHVTSVAGGDGVPNVHPPPVRDHEIGATGTAPMS